GVGAACAASAPGFARGGHRVGGARSAAALLADVGRRQALAALREPDTATPHDHRRPPLDRRGDRGVTRRSDRQSPYRPVPAPRELPAGVPACVGQQDLLHPAASGCSPSRERRRVAPGMLGADTTVEPLKPILIARTGGNPLFLEESVRTLVETDALVG